MRPIYYLILLLLSHDLMGQGEKNNSNVIRPNETYGLVVGISQYANDGIPDLNFADKDALVFSEYLRNTIVDSSALVTLINEQATTSNIVVNLFDISKRAIKGDKVYIYFSGHGDVEVKLKAQNGF